MVIGKRRKRRAKAVKCEHGGGRIVPMGEPVLTLSGMVDRYELCAACYERLRERLEEAKEYRIKAAGLVAV